MIGGGISSVYPDVDTTPQFAVSNAVQKINHEPDSEPDHKTNPGHHRQAKHQSQAHEHAEDREKRNEWDAKRPRSFRVDRGATR